MSEKPSSKKEPDKWTMIMAVKLYRKAEKIKERLRKTMPHASEKELKNKAVYLAFADMLLLARKNAIEEIKTLNPADADDAAGIALAEQMIEVSYQGMRNLDKLEAEGKLDF